MARAHPVQSLHDSAGGESSDPPARTASPTLLRPEGENAIAFVGRDREEVLVEVARLLKSRAATGSLPVLERIAVVVPSPLPYLYLAKKALGQAGIPFQLQDDFPLATEPYLAASDLILSYAELDGRRSAALGLLRSPFFRFPDVGSAAVAALDRELTKAREIGGWKIWRRMLAALKRRPVQPPLPGMEEEEHTELAALSALVQAAERLAPLADSGTPLSEKVDSVRGFLTEYGRPPNEEAEKGEQDAVGEPTRHERARGALLSILERLSDAARKVGDPPIAFQAFQDKLHRAIESHTFSTRAGRGGIQIVDARSVGLGAFEMVVLVGLNEGEWPARSDRNIFYPQWLLKDFGWPNDTELLAAERASFTELLRLSSGSVAVFRHELEEEIPTVASPFLEEVAQTVTGRQERVPTEALQGLIISRVEALRTGLAPVDERFANDRRPNTRELPFLEPKTISATAFELYLRCPFKYFSRHILGIEEEEVFDEGMTPMQRGILIHEILRKGFEQWDGLSDQPRPITEDNYHEAMALFRRVAAKRLPPERRSLELERLFGGPGQTGEIEWLLRQEMEKEPLRRRLVEYGFQNHFQFPEGPNREKPWFVRIKGRADRVDIDSRGSLHVLDYKSGRAPEAKLSLQVPLYAMCLEQQLGARAVGASYLSLRERKAVPRQDFQKVANLLKDTYRNVSEGRFAPRPSQDSLCNTCGYVGVCRKEIEELSGHERKNETVS
jgi:ATP-dependent helicase/nuclease subunit B